MKNMRTLRVPLTRPPPGPSPRVAGSLKVRQSSHRSTAASLMTQKPEDLSSQR